MTPFEIKIKYDKKIDEDGGVKTVTENFILDALSFTEAEAKITDHLLPVISGAYRVVNIKRANYSEVITDETGGYHFKCKLYFTIFDEAKGKEKKTPVYMLVEAADVESAHKKVVKFMKGTVSDYRVAGITETNILDVFVA